MTIREQALAFATEAHKGQKRKDGKDYISHPIAVAEIAEKLAREYGITQEHYLDDLYIIALGHDWIENSKDPTIESKILDEFGGYVLASVQLLSRQEKGESYFDYIQKLKAHYQDWRDPLPIIVKLSDLRHNLSDLSEGSMKDKYRFAQHLLSEMLIG